MRDRAFEIRYGDDFMLRFQYREDAERVLQVLAKRFAKYGLGLHPDKTRLIEFGRHAAANARRRSEKKPATFDFLGLMPIGARSRRGRFTIHVRTMRKRLHRSLKRISDGCQRHRQEPVAEQGEVLNTKLRGHYQYDGRPTNYRSLWQFAG